jgi:hypothetical protein
MPGKKMVLTICGCNHLRPDWKVDASAPPFREFCRALAEELSRYGIDLSTVESDAVTIDVRSYGDLLNAFRVSSPADGLSNKCVGHVIGKSANLDLLEDIRRAVNRVAFAPETVVPDDEHRKVCHNCGCNC